MIFSFALTAKKAKDLGVDDPLITGIKTQTRRCWKDSHAERIANAIASDHRKHEAWDGLPYSRSAKRLGYIHISGAPYKQRVGDINDGELFAEGNLWNKEEFLALFPSPDTIIWVMTWDHFSLD